MLAIPPKRTQRRILTYLTDPEAAALLAACDQSTWTGRRDHAILTLTLQTGLRISEVAGLTRGDVTLTAGAHVHTIGKGRKERRTPLIPTTRAVLKAWLTEVGGEPGQPLFPSTTGKHLSRDAIERRLARHLVVAAAATVVSHAPAATRSRTSPTVARTSSPAVSGRSYSHSSGSPFRNDQTPQVWTDQNPKVRHER